MIASCKRRDDLLAEYITLTECSYMSMRYVRLNLHLARLYALGVVLLSADIRACNNLTTSQKPKEAT